MFAILKLSFTALFGFFDSGDHLVAFGRFRTIPVIFRLQGFEDFLHLVAILSPVVILLVQDEPKFETRVGSANVNTILFAKLHRFVELRMFVPVEHGPNLVVFLERVLFPGLFLEVLDGFFRDSFGNAHSGHYFHGD